MKTPLVSVVLLSYNRPALLRRSITSVLSQTYKSIELVVVDNPSASSAEILALVEEFPACRLCSPAQNIGFTGGMNLGLSLCTGEYILITEDDLSLSEECIERWLRASADEPDGIFSGLILEADNGETNFCGGEISISHTLTLDLWPAPQRDDLYETDYLTGSLIFSRTQVWRRLEGFHPEFFMYMEDVEFSIRAKRLGYKLIIDPMAVCRHWGARTSTSRRDVEVHKIKNLIYVYLMYVGRWGTVLLLTRFVIGLRRGDVKHFSRAVDAVGWHIRRLLGSRPAVGKNEAKAVSAIKEIT